MQRSSRRNLRGKAKMNIIHFRALSHRYFTLLKNDRTSFIMLLLQAPIMLLVIFVACRGSFSNYWNAQSGVFVLVAIACVMGTLNSYREVCKERDVLMREYATGLDATAYVMSKIAIQALICLFHAVILVIGSWFILGLPINQWYYTIPNFFILIYLCLLSSSCLGILISCLLKNSESAILPILFLIMGQMVLSNTIIEIPQSLQFITFPVVTRWGYSGMAQIFDLAGIYGLNTGQPPTMGSISGLTDSPFFELFPFLESYFNGLIADNYQAPQPPANLLVPLWQCNLAMIIIIIISIMLSIYLVRRILQAPKK